MSNPLLLEWDTPYGMPPFERIQDADFGPAVDVALDEARKAIQGIATHAEAPTFANTIEALELADARLSAVLGAFYSLAGADSNEERETLMRDFSPKLSAYSSEVSSNKALFARIETVWAQRDTLGLTQEQARVLMLCRRSFVRSGAKLEGAAADRLAAVISRLSILGTTFSQNVLADERGWFLELTPQDIEGLPSFVKSAAISAGKSKGLDSPAVTLSRSLLMSVLKFAPNRALRKAVYEAWGNRGANGGDSDNRGIAAEILQLREERAQLLGYASFADFKLETQMAKTPGTVRELLQRVWAPARAAAERDATVLTQMLHDDGITGSLQPWDWRYYSEKRRKAEHDLDEAELKSYLQLDRMIEAIFSCATRLFGLSFAPAEGPLYHPDVRLWEVTRNGEHVALFVGDYFARESKRSGAWCSAMRAQQRLAGDIKPIVVNVCNFTKPAEGNPALLSFEEARTLFHEFGHALHQMLSDVTYESISGTSVARDFVELPSQLYEHWLGVPEVLAKFATHAETGEPMPKALLERMLAASTYDSGFQTVEYVASAMVDLSFHDGPAPADPMQKQAEVLKEMGLPESIRMRHATPHFAHVFAGDGYSCGYYSYMWSEVMDADAFAAFDEAGNPFDETLAKSLEQNIYSRGGSEDAADLYVRFRGRMPGVEPLLKGRGLAE